MFLFLFFVLHHKDDITGAISSSNSNSNRGGVDSAATASTTSSGGGTPLSNKKANMMLVDLLDKYFNENIIESHRGISDIVETYTRFGEVVIPHLDSMIHLMKKAVEDFDSQANKFYNQIPEVVKDYDWQYRTNIAIDSLIGRLGRDMFENSGVYE